MFYFAAVVLLDQQQIIFKKKDKGLDSYLYSLTLGCLQRAEERKLQSQFKIFIALTPFFFFHWSHSSFVSISDRLHVHSICCLIVAWMQCNLSLLGVSFVCFFTTTSFYRFILPVTGMITRSAAFIGWSQGWHNCFLGNV